MLTKCEMHFPLKYLWELRRPGKSPFTNTRERRGSVGKEAYEGPGLPSAPAHLGWDITCIRICWGVPETPSGEEKHHRAVTTR